MNAPDFDLARAHEFFSRLCFNKAWELIDKTERTADEDEQMLRLNQASLWHWTQREDCSDANLSIGCWQASRIHALLGRAEEARRYARLCLDRSRNESPFLLAYAHEVLARAEQIAGNAPAVAEHLAEASRLAEQVADEDDRKLLLDDLKSIA